MSEIVIRITVPDGTTYRVEAAEEDPWEGIPTTEAPPVFRGAAHGPSQDVCPVHHVAWKVIPAGISKKTGRPYDSFSACPEQGCNERPR